MAVEDGTARRSRADATRDQLKPIGRSIWCNSRKVEYELAKLAGGGFEPELHTDHGPWHYHPRGPKVVEIEVPSHMPRPKTSSKHDHYFFKCR